MYPVHQDDIFLILSEIGMAKRLNDKNITSLKKYKQNGNLFFSLLIICKLKNHKKSRRMLFFLRQNGLSKIITSLFD